MGAARSTQLYSLQFEIGRVGVRGPYVGSVHVREDALRSPKEHRGGRASAARYHIRTTQSLLQGGVRGESRDPELDSTHLRYAHT